MLSVLTCTAVVSVFSVRAAFLSISPRRGEQQSHISVFQTAACCSLLSALRSAAFLELVIATACYDEAQSTACKSARASKCRSFALLEPASDPQRVVTLFYVM